MNLYSHITGCTLLAALLMSVLLAAQHDPGSGISFTATTGTKLGKLSSNGRFRRYIPGKERLKPCYPDFNSLGTLQCPTSNPINGPHETGDEVIFKTPDNCSQVYHLMGRNHIGKDETLAAVASATVIFSRQLSVRNCSEEKRVYQCFTYSVESDRDFRYYFLQKDWQSRCQTSYYIKRLDAGTTAGTTTVDNLQQLKPGNTAALEALNVMANRTKTATLVTNQTYQIELELEEIINNLILEVSDLQTVTTGVMEIASNLIYTTKANFGREELKMNKRGVESVIYLVDRMVSRLMNVSSKESITLNFTSPELYVEVVKAVECQENISFPNRKELNKESHLFAQAMCPEGVNTTSYSGVVYNNIGALIELQTDKGSMLKTVEVLNRKKVQPTMISFTNPGFDGKVLINIKVDSQNYKDPVCVFLDMRKNMWSDKGCQLVSYDSNTVRCECDHLTNFAVLMSVIDVSVHENTTLNVLSIVCCSISIICLLVTMVIHIVYKRKLTVRNSSRVLLMTVLCGVLIFTYILFLAGITKTDNQVVCTAIAVILHLSLLTVCSLMLAIGIDYMLIVVKPLYTKHVGNQMILASFVCPVVIVGISSAATRLNGYGNDKACWLSMENLAKLAFIIPVCLVVCVNIGLVVVMFKAMFNQSTMKKKSGEEKIWTSIRNIFILSPVFGFTWIIGIFAVNKETIVFQYIFVILNGLQGVLIMVCHCVLNQKMRDILRSRTFRRKLLGASSNQATNPTVSIKESELQSTTAV